MPDPKIEPWMVAAAKEVIEAEGDGHLFRSIRNEMEATEGRRAGTDRDATQRTYEALAAIIARHAPGPASVPIGPGDVVQFHNNIMGWCTCTVTGITKDGRLQVNYSNSWTYPAESATRIGRAVYWPDGSKVEEAK